MERLASPRRRVERLHGSTPAFIVEEDLIEAVTRIASDGLAPERGRRAVLCQLANFPCSREQVERAHRRDRPDSATAILAHDEELRDVHDLQIAGDSTALVENRKSRENPIDSQEIRMSPRFGAKAR